MVLFLIPPTTLAELEEDLGVLRAAGAGSRDPEILGLLEEIASRQPGASATRDEVEAAWRAAIEGASRAVIHMKRALAASIREGREPAGARDELRALAAAIDAIKSRRQLKRGG